MFSFLSSNNLLIQKQEDNFTRGSKINYLDILEIICIMYSFQFNSLAKFLRTKTPLFRMIIQLPNDFIYIFEIDIDHTGFFYYFAKKYLNYRYIFDG